MDARHVVLAQVVIAFGALSARADTAADHIKRGAEHYKAGRYAEAVVELAMAYQLDPRPDNLFPLAQAERLSGDCKSAATHYKQVLTEISDLQVARIVQQNLELCEKPEDKPGATTCPAAPAAPPPATTGPDKPAPQPTVTKVVARDRTDVITFGLVGGGALAFGVATGLYFAAESSKDAAERANSLDTHDDLAARSDNQRIGMVIAAVVGTAAIGTATVRWVLRKPSSRAEVAVVPTTTGVGVWASGRF